MRLAQASGIDPDAADLARLDGTRPKNGRNTKWRHTHADARIMTVTGARTSRTKPSTPSIWRPASLSA